MKLEANKTGLENLMDLIASANTEPVFISADLVTPGIPVAIDPSTNGGENTAITLSAKAGSGYSGSISVKYSRINLHDILDIDTDIPEIYFETTASSVSFSDVVAQFNSQYGLNLTADDFVDGVFPTVSDNYIAGIFSSSLTVQMASTSLLFQGPLTVRWVNAVPGTSLSIGGSVYIGSSVTVNSSITVYPSSST
jgi:hypothetical protein